MQDYYITRYPDEIYYVDYDVLEPESFQSLREGWLKPHKQLNPITYSGNGMIDRLINNRVREPGRA